MLEFQTCISGIWDPLIISILGGGYPFFGGSWRGEGAFGVVSWHGSDGGADMGGCFGIRRGGRTYSRHRRLPFPPSVCYHQSLQPATSPSLAHVIDGSEGLRPSAFCFLSHAFFSSLTSSHSRAQSLSFVSLLLLFFFFCRSHSSGGASVKGS